MLYRLETPDGQIRKFHVEACAQLYQGVYGGVVYLQEDSTIEDLESLREYGRELKLLS